MREDRGRDAVIAYCRTSSPRPEIPFGVTLAVPLICMAGAERFPCERSTQMAQVRLPPQEGLMDQWM